MKDRRDAIRAGMRPRAGIVFTAGVIATLAAGSANAQYSAENVALYRQISIAEFGTGADNGNDCWGYVAPSGREYALMGLSNALAVVEITDPANPNVIDTVNHTNSLWGDMKVFQNYVYVVNEAGGGIDIVDLAGVDNGRVTLVRRFTGNSVRSAHNVVINEQSGYLYLVGANINGGRLVAFDLNADPENPAYAGQASGAYVHDAHVITYSSGPYADQEIAFCADGSSGIQIWDVTNKGAMSLLSTTTYPGIGYCHQCWTSEDGQYLFVNDELDEINGSTPTTRTLVFDIADLSNPALVTTFTSGLPASDHNLYVRDGIVYEANYQSGLRIFDATDPLNATEIGWFDTYPASDGAGFNGAWSCFPFFPSGTVIVSDMSRGLFILDVSAALSGLSFEFPEGQPEFINPDGGTSMQVRIIERSATYQSGSAMLHVDRGNGFEANPMEPLGENLFLATFPTAPGGDDVQYYVSARTTENATFVSPSNAPLESYSALAAFGLEVSFADNFENNLGWQVSNSNVTAGAWERAIPAGNNGGRGDPRVDFDGSGHCYVTGNGLDEDLDGGPTILTSPRFDAGRPEAMVRFGAWFTNDDGDDRLRVELSNDDGSNWTEAEVIASTAGWELHEIPIADILTPTSTMKIRFIASDNPNNSVTEGAIDAFQVAAPVCLDPFTLEADPLFAGQNAHLWVNGATPGEAVYFVYSLRGFGSAHVPALNVTLDLRSPTLADSAIADDTGYAEILEPIPNIATPRLVWLQAAEYGRTTGVLVEQVN